MPLKNCLHCKHEIEQSDLIKHIELIPLDINSSTTDEQGNFIEIKKEDCLLSKVHCPHCSLYLLDLVYLKESEQQLDKKDKMELLKSKAIHQAPTLWNIRFEKEKETSCPCCGYDVDVNSENEFVYPSKRPNEHGQYTEYQMVCSSVNESCPLTVEFKANSPKEAMKIGQNIFFNLK